MPSPLDIVKSFYQSIARGDASAALSLLAPLSQWTEAYGSRYHAGTWIGPEAVRVNLLERLAMDWNSFAVEPDAYVTEGPNIVAFGTYRGIARLSGNALAAAFAHRFEIVDQKITVFRQFTDTAEWDRVFEKSAQ